MFLSCNNIFTFISEDLTRYILYLEYSLSFGILQSHLPASQNCRDIIQRSYRNTKMGRRNFI